MAVVDFTNPKAAAWYSSLIEKLLLTGVDTIKTDFGERIPHIDVTFHDGSNSVKMHK
jgi:alpha-glucosidase (family GH31 glycosyl hydrolase)